MNEVAVQCYKKVRPRFASPDGTTTPAWYNAAALALTATGLDFGCLSFVCLNLRDALSVHAHFGWAPPLLTLGAFAFTKFGLRRPPRRAPAGKKKD